MQRRTFFGAVFSGIGGVAAARPLQAKSGDIPKRTLGRTGEKLTIIGMGGARFHLVPLEDGKAVVRRAYDLGITYFDMARGYFDGHAEEVYGAVIPDFRQNIFLTSKSGQRTRQGAEADLEKSLKTMRTDYLDLWQMHSVSTQEDIDKILSPGGALEAFVAAKKAGKVRFIGFTGHVDPAVHLQLLRSCDNFDTILMPLHAADTVYLSFEKNTLPAAVERGMGIFAMKVVGDGYLLRTFNVKECLNYTFSLPITAATLGFNTIGQVEDDVRAAQNFKQLSAGDMEDLRARARAKRPDVASGPEMEFWKRKI